MEGILLAGGVLAAFVGLLGALHYWSHEAMLRRRLRKAPRTPIERFEEGSVGKIVGTLHFVGSPLEAPVSGRSCAYFQVELETRTKNGWALVKKERKACRAFEVVDDTGVALVEVADPKQVSVSEDVSHEKSIATAEPAPELERYVARAGYPNEGMGMRVVEGVLEEGERVAVLGRGTREPWSDPRAHRGSYRTAGTRLAIRAHGRVPVLVSDDRQALGDGD